VKKGVGQKKGAHVRKSGEMAKSRWAVDRSRTSAKKGKIQKGARSGQRESKGGQVPGGRGGGEGGFKAGKSSFSGQGTHRPQGHRTSLNDALPESKVKGLKSRNPPFPSKPGRVKSQGKSKAEMTTQSNIPIKKRCRSPHHHLIRIKRETPSIRRRSKNQENQFNSRPFTSSQGQQNKGAGGLGQITGGRDQIQGGQDVEGGSGGVRGRTKRSKGEGGAVWRGQTGGGGHIIMREIHQGFKGSREQGKSRAKKNTGGGRGGGRWGIRGMLQEGEMKRKVKVKIPRESSQ